MGKGLKRKRKGFLHFTSNLFPLLIRRPQVSSGFLVLTEKEIEEGGEGGEEGEDEGEEGEKEDEGRGRERGKEMRGGE